LTEAKTLTRYFLSVDAWEKNSKGHSVAEEIAKECLKAELVDVGGRQVKVTWPHPEQADNQRIGGWRFLYAMMKKTQDVLGGVMNPTRKAEDFDVEGGGYSEATPLVFISGECGDVIEAVPMAIRDEKHIGRGEDVLKQPTKADDVNDCLRYLTKSMLNPRIQAPVSVQAQEKWQEMGDADPTVKAIAMRKIEAENKKRQGGRKSTWLR